MKRVFSPFSVLNETLKKARNVRIQTVRWPFRFPGRRLRKVKMVEFQGLAQWSEILAFAGGKDSTD